MLQSQPRITEDENGCQYLIVGTDEYELGNRNEVHLDGIAMPSLWMDEVPDGVSFLLNYKFVLISVPLFFRDNGNIGVALGEEVGDAFGEYESSPFMDFWKESPFFVEECEEEYTGVCFAALDLSGEMLAEVFDRVKKIIDEFWDRYKSVYDQLTIE